jgi:hypothetical protein
VFVVPVGGEDANLAVTDLELVSGVLRKGTTARYRATVRNCGSAAASNITVQCRVDGVEIDRKIIPMIEAGASETVSLFVPFHNAGAARITAEISGDALAADNVRRTVAVVRDRVSVLCVDGSSGDAGRLVVAALLARADGIQSEDYVVRSVPWLAFPGEDLGQVDVHRVCRCAGDHRAAGRAISKTSCAAATAWSGSPATRSRPVPGMNAPPRPKRRCCPPSSAAGSTPATRSAPASRWRPTCPTTRSACR